jgi:type VI protein secretion system component VasA
VLDHFLALYHHINNYSQLKIIVRDARSILDWPPRLGGRRLV